MKRSISIFALVFFISVLAISGCSDDGPTAPGIKQELNLSGQLTDWTYGDDKILTFASGPFSNIDTVAFCKISADGTYNLSVPAEPQNLKLKPVRDFFGIGFKGALIISDPAAQVGAGRLLLQTEGNNFWGVIEWNYTEPLPEGEKSYQMIYYYFDRPVSVKGTLECLSCGGQISVFNINAKAGWNVFWYCCRTDTRKFYYEDYKPVGGKYEYWVVEEVEGLINSGSMFPYNQTPYNED